METRRALWMLLLLNVVITRNMEDWKVTIDDECLLLDSKHYETCGITYHLDAYNAYDDKGNKIEGKYIELIKKEYDNDIRRS